MSKGIISAGGFVGRDSQRDVNCMDIVDTTGQPSRFRIETR
jgi:hypothetical protein